MKQSVVQEESPLSQPMASINSPHVSIGNNMNAYAYSGRSTVSPSLTGRSSPTFGDFNANERRDPSQSAYVKCRKLDFNMKKLGPTDDGVAGGSVIMERQERMKSPKMLKISEPSLSVNQDRKSPKSNSQRKLLVTTVRDSKQSFDVIR